MSRSRKNDFDLGLKMKPLKDKETVASSSYDDGEPKEDENRFAFAKLCDVEDLGPGPGLKPAPLSTGLSILKPIENNDQTINEKAKDTPATYDQFCIPISNPISPLKHNVVDEIKDENIQIQKSLESNAPPRAAWEPPAVKFIDTRPMVVDYDEAKALDDWVKSERINEPLGDIPEYKLLLDLAKNYEQNYDILLKVLTPKSTFKTPAKEVQKPLPAFLTGKHMEKPMQFPMPAISIKIKQEPRNTSRESYKGLPMSHLGFSAIVKPEAGPQTPLPPLPPAIPVPPAPACKDVNKRQRWLDVCSNIVSKQIQYIEIKVKNENQRVSADLGVSLDNLAPETSTYAIFDEEILGYTKPQIKMLCASWFQQFSAESMPNLRRQVVLATVYTILDKRLSTKISAVRHPKRHTISVQLKYSNFFCTLQVNNEINLRSAARLLDCAVYKPSIEVIQQTFDTIRLAWAWANGSVMIINGTTKAALIETQNKLLPKLTGDTNFIRDPSKKILYLRLVSRANYPWLIDLRKFSQAETLCGPLFVERYVYYVNKEYPCVLARVHESGEVHVFAMNTSLANKILAKLYTISYKYRMLPA